MNDNVIFVKGLTDEHLDNMIRLALQYSDAIEAEQIVRESDDLSGFESPDIIRQASEKLHDINRKEKISRRTKTLVKKLRNTVNILTFLISIVAITIPVAIAAIPELKTYVSGLFVEHYSTYAEIRMYDEPLPPLEIPEAWKGEFYLSYISEGYELVDIDVFFNIATYMNDSGHMLYFIESDDTDGFIMDNEDVVINYAEINGSEIMFMEKQNRDMIYAIWTNGEEVFQIIGNVPMSEMIELVYGVRSVHIQKLDFLPVNEPEDARKKW